MRTGSKLMVASALLIAFAAAPSAHAFHLYRNSSFGCSETDGATGATATAVTTVQMLHNLFIDGTTNTPITHITAGQTVKWTWNSLHCHSVEFDRGTPGNPYSGFHYPTYVPPGFINAVPGFFEYPQLSSDPTLSWSFTFNTPGIYHYECEHHYDIGMHGVVIVDPA